MAGGDSDILDRLLDHLRASTEAQAVNAERLESLSAVVAQVHRDLDRRNAVEVARIASNATLWAKAGSKPMLIVYSAVIYVVLAALGVDPGPLIRAVVGTDHVAHTHEAAPEGDVGSFRR